MDFLAREVLLRFELLVIAYFVVVNGIYLVLLGAAARELHLHLARTWHESRWRLLSSEMAPRISVLAPAHNEASSIVESVRALLTLRYPNLEVVVVNDGSTDATLEVATREFALRPEYPAYRLSVPSAPVRTVFRSETQPRLVVIDKENGGKADALNAGLNICTGELVCAIDADTLIEPEAMLRMVRPFLERDDVVAAGGTIRVANRCEVVSGRVRRVVAPDHALAGAQVVEYLRAFLFGRLGWNRLGGNLIISGAFGLFRRQALLDAGGYLHGTVGEDMELVARLRRRAYENHSPGRVAFVPDPVAWTEVPETFRGLARQRDRWHRGLADVLWRHRRMLANPRYGALGLVVMPYFVVIELLAPIVEALGLIGLAAGLALGMIDHTVALLFFVVAYGFGLVLSLSALMLEEAAYHRLTTIRDRLWLLLWAMVESTGFRQLTVAWRLRGLWRFLRGNAEWGVMTRKGFTIPTERPDAAVDADGSRGEEARGPAAPPAAG